MKFLHTADWQIGMKALHVGESGETVREKRLVSLQAVMDVARRENVEFVLVAGDLFEDNGVDRLLVQKVVDTISKPQIPVYIIPGNHDPYVPGSVWEHRSWKTAETVHVLQSPECVEIPGGLLYPCPALDKHSLKDPTEWIAAQGSSQFHIGLAHGSVEGVDTDLDFPISRDAPCRRGLDYLALGHFHSFAVYKTPDQSERMAYSGTHETTKFGERDSGNVLLVEIPKPLAPPKVTTVKTGCLKWRSLNKDLRDVNNLLELQREVESLESPENTLLEITLNGFLTEDGSEVLKHLEEIVASRFLYNRIRTESLLPLPQENTWTAILPPGHLRAAGEMLREWANPQYEGIRPEGATAKLAAKALLELYALAKEEGR